MSNSSLSCMRKISPMQSGRRSHRIDRITPHCVVGQTSVNWLCEFFYSSGKEASCNYGIGCDGRICTVVDEQDHSWCSSNWDNDDRVVNIECASDSFHPYAVNANVWKALVELCTDICQRNGKKKLLWFADKAKTLAYQPKTDEMVLTAHRWFDNKSCPGDYIYDRLGQIAKEVNQKLSGVPAEPFKPYQGQVNADDGLNCRTDPISGSVIKAFEDGTVLTITKEDGNWGYCGEGWVCLDYINKIASAKDPAAKEEIIMDGKTFKKMYDEVNPTYNTLDEVPSYWRADIKELVDKGMRNVAERVKGPAQTPEVSAKGLAGMEKQLKALGAEFDAALDKADKLRSQLDISRQLRPISDVEKAQYSAATQEVEKLSNSYHELEERIHAVKSANAEKAAGIGASTTQAVDGVAKKLEALNKVSEKVSQTKMEGPSIDAGVTAEIENATRQVEGLQEAAERVDKVQVEVGGQMSGQFSGISQADLTEGINSAFSGTKFSGKVGSITNLAQEFGNMSTAANSAGAAAQAAGTAGAGAMAGLAAAIGPVVAALELVKQKFNENKEFLQSDRSLWTDTSWEQMGEGVQNVTAALMIFNPWMEKAIYGMRSLIQPGQELLSVLGSLAESGFKKAGSALQSFAASGFEKAGNAMKSMVTGIGDGIKSIGANVGKKLVQPFTGAIAAIQKWKESLGRMAFYKAINTAINTVTNGLKTGMDNLYKFSQMADGKFAASMDSLASSSMYLSNSLGAMAAPLINAVAPAIDFIIGKIVSLINMLGTLFAVISGAGSFTQAKKQAVSYGDAIGGAAGAAKELQDYVLGIDELNIIKENAGGGGGGGGGMGFEDMFEEVPLPDWAKEMQDAINRGDWYGAGEILADHLNGIIDSWDAEAWGKKLGEKINHGLDFALGFLRKFDFDELGGKLADAINGIGESLDFDTLGRVIGAGWNAVFETANGFFKRLDWKM